MADETIIQNLISELGQSRNERTPPELRSDFVGLDERAPGDVLLFLRRIAASVRYYGVKVQDGVEIVAEQGDWTPFFPGDDASLALLPGDASGAAEPHLALLAAFLDLYDRFPRAALNRIPGRHLDFYYRRVLGFEPKPPVADRAHVVIGLKRGSPPILLRAGHRFSAGKDEPELEAVRDTVIGSARVESLRSIFLPPDGSVRFAPIANSSDGLGGELPAGEPKWKAFGHIKLPQAEIGFAFASPVLRMAEGERRVRLSLHLGGLTGTPATGSLQAFLTGEKGWLGPYVLEATPATGGVDLSFTVPPGDKAVADYDPAVHGLTYTAQAPVLQIVLGKGSTAYASLKRLSLIDARISVEVSGITSLVLESDAGRLDPKKAFLPFGPQPAAGARFLVGCAEAFSKKLSGLALKIEWQGVPADFTTRYANYGEAIDRSSFTATATFEDSGGWPESRSGIQLFNPPGERVLSFERSTPPVPRVSPVPATAMFFTPVQALLSAHGEWATNQAFREVLAQPLQAFATPPQPRGGFLTLTLERDLLHAAFRRKTIEHALQYAKSGTNGPIVLYEPYTPVIQGISLSYNAHTATVRISSEDRGDFTDPDLQFFHAGCFGQMREHGYQRKQLGFADREVPLFPRYDDEGELLVGLAGLEAGDSVSVLFQVAEGSADPDAERQPVRWHVLADNYWRRLESGEVVLDTTNQFLTSGTVTFVIPPQATTRNTILPAGPVWLKASVPEKVDSVSELIGVAANAVEVRQAGIGKGVPLPAGSIAKLKTPVAAVKTVTQPYASFGGRPSEPDAELQTRASERLRHRNRCLTPWDYERIVLDAFPVVHRVKCIPHAEDGNWLAPGHVLIVVVPDLRNQNARDRLRPRVDADTLERISRHLQAHAGMQVSVKVKNADFLAVHVGVKAKLRPGCDLNFYRSRLGADLIRFLSPWVDDPQAAISFGGRLHKSVLLDFIDELGYVDYIAGFRLHAGSAADLDEVRALRPDTILVSDHEHSVEVF